MLNERLNGLLTYLDALNRLNGEFYSCHKEIAECIAEIRTELEISNAEKPNVNNVTITLTAPNIKDVDPKEFAQKVKAEMERASKSWSKVGPANEVHFGGGK